MLAARTSVAVIALIGVAMLAASTRAAGGAPPQKEQVKLTPADQAAARAAVMTRADLSTTKGWTGGFSKLDLSAGPTCASYHPRRSDVVITGVAGSLFRHHELELLTEARVFRTAHMVALDWQRTVQAPGAVTCLRQMLGGRAKLLSFGRTPFPKVAQYAAEYRAVIDAPGGTITIRFARVGRSRTEITIVSYAPSAADAPEAAAVLRLSRVLVSRIRA